MRTVTEARIRPRPGRRSARARHVPCRPLQPAPDQTALRTTCGILVCKADGNVRFGDILLRGPDDGSWPIGLRSGWCRESQHVSSQHEFSGVAGGVTRQLSENHLDNLNAYVEVRAQPWEPEAIDNYRFALAGLACLLAQLGVFPFCSLEDRDVGIRISPQAQEILVRGFCIDLIPR